jgi:hypothetical protein
MENKKVIGRYFAFAIVFLLTATPFSGLVSESSNGKNGHADTILATAG